MVLQPPVLLFRCNRPIPSSTYVGLSFFLVLLSSHISYLKDPAVYPHFDIYRTGSPRKEDEQVPLLTMLPAQYPALSLCEFRHHNM